MIQEIARRVWTHYHAHGSWSLLKGILRKLDKTSGFRYQRWIQNEESIRRITEKVIQEMQIHPDKPKLAVFLDGTQTDIPRLKNALKSVLNQSLPPGSIQLCIPTEAVKSIKQMLESSAHDQVPLHILEISSGANIVGAMNQHLSSMDADWICILDSESILHKDALAEASQQILDNPQIQLLYADEDQIGLFNWRSQPWFKPDWDPLRFWGQNYLGSLFFLRTSGLAKLGGRSEKNQLNGFFDLLLCYSVQVICDESEVLHLSLILSHRQKEFSTVKNLSNPLIEAEAKFLENHLADQKISAWIEPLSRQPRWRRVHFIPNFQPPVQVIIPTRDRLDLLRNCVDGILYQTDYAALQVLIVDNDSQEEETLSWIQEKTQKDSRVAVLKVPGPFNFPKINNLAVRSTSAEYILLLNNDIKVLHPDWLNEMVGVLQLPKVGAVGARLLYPNGLIQHAGVTLGVGLFEVAGHTGANLSADSLASHGQYQLLQQVEACSAACLLVKRTAWEAVGGLNEQLAINFNDVDFCLELKQAGWQVVWTSCAELMHVESASRGHAEHQRETPEFFLREVAWMKEKWGTRLQSKKLADQLLQ